MSNSIYFFPGGAKATLGEVGGKGLSLLESSRALLPVPPGCILTVYFFEPWLSQLKTTDAWKKFLEADNDALAHACAVLKQTAAAFPFTGAQEKILTEALRKFDTDALFAVRSSSPHEDLEGASFAGGYETVLGTTQDTLHDAVRRCFLSSLDNRVVVYMRANDFDATDPKIAVVVQKQIASDISGVGFSLNPVTNNYDDAVFNANWGLGETVVAGLVTPDTFTVDKVREEVKEAVIGSKELSIWLTPKGGTEERKQYRSNDQTLSQTQLIELTRLVANVEKIYGMPMDIEWAYEHDRLYLLQARPITTYVPLAPDMVTEPGRTKRLYFDVTATAQGMTEPLSKMGTTLFRRLLKVVGRLVFARNISKDIDTTIPWISEGKLYFNVSNWIALIGKSKLVEFMPAIDPLGAKAVEQLDEQEYASPTQRVMLLPFGLLLKLPGILFFIRRAKTDPEGVHRWVQERLLLFEAEAKRITARDAPLTEMWDELTYKMFKQVFSLTVPLTVAARRALGRIKRVAGDDRDAAKLERALPHNVTTEMGLALAGVATLLPDGVDATQLQKMITERALPEECLRAWQHFLDSYGFRGASEIDVAAPRYRDDPRLLVELLLTMKNSTGESPQEAFERRGRERRIAFESLIKKLHTRDPGMAEKFAKDYLLFETFGGYRETHKKYLVYVVAILRQRILAQAETLVAMKRLESIQQVFDLTVEQLDASRRDNSIDLKKLARENTGFLKRLARVKKPPAVIDSRGFIPRPPIPPLQKGEYVGTGVSTGNVRGRIKILHNADEKPLLKGEILVARATDPGWTPLFVNAGGIILEVGGSLQHGALVAREYGIPCVAGVENATTLWQDGTLVEVDGSAGIIRTIENS
jgi:phosphohistidine swiveling domain-containing protein